MSQELKWYQDKPIIYCHLEILDKKLVHRACIWRVGGDLPNL